MSKEGSYLYGRLADSMLATWGLSLIVVQTATLIFGASTQGISTPGGSFVVGDYSVAWYSLWLIAAAAGLMLLLYLVFTRTRYGVMARALMTQPRLLLLDEPSEGIQPSIVAQIVDTIGQIHQQQGIAVVVVEQNLDFVARLNAHCHIMDRGRLVFDCPAQGIVRDKTLQQQYLGV